MTRKQLKDSMRVAGIYGALVTGSPKKLVVWLPDDDAMAKFTFDVAHWLGSRRADGSWTMRPFYR
jgi:hypothetical protein